MTIQDSFIKEFYTVWSLVKPLVIKHIRCIKINRMRYVTTVLDGKTIAVIFNILQCLPVDSFSQW